MKKVKAVCVVSMEDEFPDEQKEFCGAETIAYMVETALKEYIHSKTGLKVDVTYLSRDVIDRDGARETSTYRFVERRGWWKD